MRISKFTYLLLAFFFASFNLSAQEESPARLAEEIGVRLISLQDFDLIYKKELKNGNYRRIRLASINFGLSSTDNTQTVLFSAGVAVAIGCEKRVAVADKLVFHHGWEPGIALGFTTVEDFNQLMVNPFIGYVLGFQLSVSESFTLGLEVTPSAQVSYSVRNSRFSNSFRANVGFNSGAVGLTATYRFTRR